MRVQGIVSDTRRGGRPADRDMVTRIIEMTMQTRPENTTHWSTRTLAARLGTSDTMVQRAWKANGLKPHRIEAGGFKSEVQRRHDKSAAAS